MKQDCEQIACGLTLQLTELQTLQDPYASESILILNSFPLNVDKIGFWDTFLKL